MYCGKINDIAFSSECPTMKKRIVHRSPRAGAWLAAALLALGAAPVRAADAAGDFVAAPPARSWQLELGGGASYVPDYSGSSTSSPRALLWASGEYQTESWGKFALDSGSLTISPELRWNFVDGRDAALGLLLGYRSGRSDSKTGSLGSDSGSSSLKGMGSVNFAIDAGVQGHVTVLGVPLFGQLRAALDGDQGTLAILGAYLPFELGDSFQLTVLPSATWANTKQMHAFYGVTPAQSTASGFAAYQVGSGWQTAALELAGDWKIAGPWHAVASIAYQRLLGSAAASPLTLDKNQVSGLLGLSYRF